MSLAGTSSMDGAVAALVAALASGCADAPTPAAVNSPPRAGGDTTVVDRTSNAYSFPAPNLHERDLATHLEGDVAFEATFVSPPAPVHAGLGPTFNNNACDKCHVRDGRGLPVAGAGPLGSALVVRISSASAPDEVVGVPGLGIQIQDHAVYGSSAEASVRVGWVEQAVELGDGSVVSLRRPSLAVVLADGRPLPGDVRTSPRIPPPVFGLGLLEAVAEADVAARSDPDDADGDGISGRAASTTSGAIGRFGWKASTASLIRQASAEYADDMGVSSPLLPERDGSSEIDEHTAEVTAFYTSTLAVPQRDRWDAPVVLEGEALFRDLGCGACHVETLRTGDHTIAALRGQSIHAYTDLLLHNMGFDLADGRVEGEATGTEWRTAPLWGLGLAQTVLPGACFLHDGRARSIEEAILWHGGEAERSRELYRTSSSGERSALLGFLGSL